MGPFRALGDGPVTPRDWESLDGTLYVDHNSDPWMVFCHEWVQVQNGEICAVRLNQSVDSAISEPVVLFRAADAPWVHPVKGGANFVTDGPFLHQSASGELLMLWSSFGQSGYAVGIAKSVSGNILGQWIQMKEPIFSDDGGHCMLFYTFEGELLLSIHGPNKLPYERPVFIPAASLLKGIAF
ncbi:MAG: hypothetical protein A2189_09295 [Paenibacillus sp. RIFOXYA1_FULL_44_5]|nr:MAG: hypothetical protein A2189_09295 [Paenibacillus sp. RIFOXYA1_FULL_44_5]